MKKTNLLILLGFLTISSLHSQMHLPSNYVTKLSYTEFESNYYIVPKNEIDSLAKIDKVKLKEFKSELGYEKYMDHNNKMTTVISLLSSEGIYKDWMQKPEIIIIDEFGAKTFTNEGQLITDLPNTNKYYEIKGNAPTGNSLFVNMGFPDQNKLVQINNFPNVSVHTLFDGSIEIATSGKKIVYNEHDLYKIETEFDQNGLETWSKYTYYQRLPSGEIVYDRIRESVIEEFLNGILVKKVNTRIFSDYVIEGRSDKSATQNKPKKVNVTYANNQSELIITYDQFGQSNSAKISIYSTRGNVVKSFETANTGRFTVSIDDLSAGIYVIRIVVSENTLSQKFVKL